MKKFISEEKRKWDQGIEKINSKRHSWNEFKKNAIEYFNKVRDEGKKQRLFDEIYVYEAGDSAIGIFWGSHATGRKDFRDKNSTRLVVESGCGMNLSVFEGGEVIVSFKPFHTTLSEPINDHLVLWIFSSANQISNKKLKYITKLFFIYSRYTSFLNAVDGFDKFHLFILKSIHFVQHARNKDIFSYLIAKVDKMFESKLNELAGESSESAQQDDGADA